jgi:hypothetical protein
VRGKGEGRGVVYRECTPRPKRYSVSVSARAIFDYVRVGAFFIKTADHFKEIFFRLHGQGNVLKF